MKGSPPARVLFARGEVADAAKNCWADKNAAEFMVRGPSYLTDHVKQPSQRAAFRLTGVAAVKTSVPLVHAAARLPELVAYLAAHTIQTFLVVTWMLPGTPAHGVVQVFVREAPHDGVFDVLYTRFMDGDEEFRANRFKSFCKLVSAPWLVSAAVSQLGGERPAILGKKLAVAYHRGANYFEVDVDVASSKIASMVNGVILRGASGIVVDLGFTMEGQADDELPERMMGCVRFQNCDIGLVAVDKTATL